jgi:hypothetical protein
MVVTVDARRPIAMFGYDGAVGLCRLNQVDQ